MSSKWLAPILPYLAVWAGLFLLHSAWGALIGFHLAILFVLRFFRADVPFQLLFKSTNPKWILASVIFCGASGVILYFVWDWFGIYENLPEQVQAIGLNSATWLPFIAYFAIINPLVEEIFWRGFLGSNAQKFYAGDLVYAGYHVLVLWDKVPLPSIVFALACLTTVGWFWRQLRREDEGLLAPVLGHAAADFTILMCVYLQTRLTG